MSDETRPAERTAAPPRNLAEARQAVAATRARVSATLGELEGRLAETREAVQGRLDVVRPVRSVVRAAPLVAVALAAGAGLALGIATGGRRATDRVAVGRGCRGRRKQLHAPGREDLPRAGEEPSRLGRFLRDLAHDLAGAATAMLVRHLIGRVRDERE